MLTPSDGMLPARVNTTPPQQPGKDDQKKFDSAVDKQKTSPQATPVSTQTKLAETEPAEANPPDKKTPPGASEPSPGAKALDAAPGGKIEHKVQPDENLTKIAGNYGVTVDDLKISNPGKFADPSQINEGDTVVVFDKARRDNAVAMNKAVDTAHQEQADLDELKQQVGNQSYQRLLRANPEMEDGVKQAWADVRELATEEMYYAGTDSRTPIDGLDATAKDITSRFPGDPELAKQVNAAKVEVTKIWEATGRTAQVQNELTRLTDNVNKATASDQGVDQARKELQDYLVDKLHDAKTNNAGSSDPMLRLAGILAQSDAAGGGANPNDVLAQQLLKEAMTPPGERAVRAEALVLATYGPDDPAFRAAVEGAQHHVLAVEPAEEVAKAYANPTANADGRQQSGPEAAMAKLKEVTGRDVATEDTAAAIMREAMPTTQAVVKNIGAFEKDGEWHLPEGVGYPSQHDPTLPLNTHNGDRLPDPDGSIKLEERILADLSAASDHARFGQGGEEVVRDIAASIIKEAPNWDEAGLDERMFYGAVAGGEGASLQLETIKQLKAAGRTDDASDLMNLFAEGASKVPGGIRSTVDDFFGTGTKEGSGQELTTLINDWKGKLTDAQLNQAVQSYLDKHPDKVEEMQADLDRIGVAGYSSVQFERAWDAYKGDLQGLEGADRVDGAVKEMQGDTEKIKYARSALPALQETARQDLSSLNIDGNKLFVQPASTLRSLAKSLTAGAFYANVDRTSIPLNSRLGIFTNGSASLLAGGASSLLLFHDGQHSVTEYLYGGYFGVASLKEGTEAFAGWTTAIGKAKDGGLLKRIGTGDAPNWTRFASGLAAVGSGIDIYSAVVSAGKGGWENWVAGGLSAVSGISGFVGLAVGGPIPAIVGAVAVAASFGFNEWRNVEHANRYEGPTEDFLKDAGLRPEIAKQLSNHDGDGVSASARLGPLAKHLGVSEQDLVAWLNQQNPGFVGDFVKNALHSVTPDDGDFKETNAGDEITKSTPYAGRGPAPQDLHIIGTTSDGKFRVKRGDQELVMTAEQLRSANLEPHSLEGIRLWAMIEGHPLPHA